MILTLKMGVWEVRGFRLWILLKDLNSLLSPSSHWGSRNNHWENFVDTPVLERFIKSKMHCLQQVTSRNVYSRELASYSFSSLIRGTYASRLSSLFKDIDKESSVHFQIGKWTLQGFKAYHQCLQGFSRLFHVLFDKHQSNFSLDYLSLLPNCLWVCSLLNWE